MGIFDKVKSLFKSKDGKKKEDFAEDSIEKEQKKSLFRV